MQIEIQKDNVEEKLNIGRRIVNLMGPEGSGKTSIAKRLAVESGKPYLTVGELLRDLAKNDPGLYGDEARSMFAEHRYFTDRQMLLDIYANRFAREDLADGFILDGGLRSIEEVIGFQSTLDKAGRSMPVINIFLRVPGWISIQRLSTDPNARNRDDDTVEGVLSRLSRYYDQLGKRASLVGKQPNWSLLHINGTRTLEEVFEEVQSALLEVKNLKS